MSEFTLVINRRAQKNRSRYTQKCGQPNRQTVPTHTYFRQDFPLHHDSVGQYAGKTVQVQGAWRTNMKVNTTEVVDLPRRQQKVRPSSNKKGIECAYCHEHGHHIRNCQKAVDATARKQQSRFAARQKQAEDKLNRAEERLRQKVIAAQQASQLAQQPVVVEEENSDSDSDTDSQCEVVDSQVKIAHIENLIASKKLELKTTKSWADRTDLSEDIDELEEELAGLRC